MAAGASLQNYLGSGDARVSYANIPDEKDFIRQPACFTKNSLTVGGWQVMDTWIRSYMKTLASIATKNGGNILEVGYGMGLAARAIRENPKVKNHTIIEVHPGISAHAEKMFKKEIAEGKVNVITGFWEDAIGRFPKGSFDGILFDSYYLGGAHLCSKAKTRFSIVEDASKKKVLNLVFRYHHPFFKEAYSLLKKGGVFTYYSNEEKGFSAKHLNALKRTGFSKIDYRICGVNPPKSCPYWKHKTIVAPMIIK
ncbi:MAG: class I SAM-dependent methyltransferase [Candidatus Diapherotrites archaeon]